MDSVICYNYTVYSKEELIIKELKEIKRDKRTRINWFNFEKGDIYYSNDGVGYTIKYIDHINKNLELEE